MPTYRNPQTGDIVELPGDSLKEFYESKGWVQIDKIADEPPGPTIRTVVDDGDEEPKKKGK